MNTHALAVIVTCSMLVITSCRKPDRPYIPCPKEKDKCFVLRELQTSSHTYVFHYDQAGLVDSISGTNSDEPPFVIRVARNGRRIDSVYPGQNGESFAYTSKDFRYDDKGRITGYTFYSRNVFPAVVLPVFITYGPDGNIATISSDGLTDSLTFNQNNDVVRWRESGLTFHIVSTFTYDTKVNPLYCIDDLFAILGDAGVRQFMFSQHNSIGQVRTWHPDDDFREVSMYENKYDAFHRLTKKIIKRTIFFKGQPAEYVDSLMFRY
jgi:hypothetical protein